MAKKGYIYKGLKPVYWCPDCRTALAEAAEIEYGEDDRDSIFVRFTSLRPQRCSGKARHPDGEDLLRHLTTTT